jgi:hypothetical protein
MTTHIPLKRAVNNIIRYYHLANEIEHELGYRWYADAHHWCIDTAVEFQTTVDKVAGIIAALSPGCTWEQNKIDTRSAIRYFKSETQTLSVSTYGQFVKKAQAIWDGHNIPTVLNGPKITAFYHNILNPYCDKWVCVDRHAFKIARHIKKAGPVALTAKQVRDTQHAYKEAAGKLSLRPCVLQAITWITYKRIHNR